MKSLIAKPVFFLGLLFWLGACQPEKETLFTRLPSGDTGIDFNNHLQEDGPGLNILSYPYFYNGGGVAVGDINNDGLQDMLFTGNTVENALYLNKGALKFEDISHNAGVTGKKGWCTGATMVDINHDGWLDIYICRSGLPEAQNRRNLLYINNRDLTFTERASQYGLDDPGYSTQASFFDYDRDGDLDMFLINQSDPKFSRGYLDYVQTRFQKGDSSLANKLYRNDDDHFVNVSAAAGIQSNVFTFSLGVSTTDINQDGWPDIYVANDFEERDYLYINRRDGTFADSLTAMMDHNSMYSMGVDVADYNNDLFPDVIVLDMLPESNYARKMHMGGDNYTHNNYMFRNGMFFQYMKNTLQKNNGDGTFSEVAQQAGVSATDWSWSPLFADYDNDGLKDLFVTNGYKHDNTSMEFVVYSMAQSQHIQQGGKAPAVPEYISHMPGISLPNYMFRNLGDQFQNNVKDWGFDHNTFSHGAAYADLDNDGDLELITNNTDSEAGIYRNNAEHSGNNFLRIKLQGSAKNPVAIGARIYAYAGTDKYYLEQNPVRGYQSSVDSYLHLGLGKHDSLDSLRVVWPEGTSQLVLNAKANTTLTVALPDAKLYHQATAVSNKMMTEIDLLAFRHKENEQNDFAKQFLLPHFLSHTGPCLAKGDVNGDGRADVFVGGASGQGSAIFLQRSDGTFRSMVMQCLIDDAAYEDVDAALFDADGDKDLDLYVVSGGYGLEENAPALQDRLYLNDGKGGFVKSSGALPANLSNKKCVRPVDFDGDGDLDLFVGGGVIPGKYPLFSPSKIYFNNGKGNFSVVKPANAALGLVNDALWIDLNGDGKKDLIVAGEWMPLKAFLTQGSLFADVSKQWFPWASEGWWNCIASGDFDHDGDLDLVVGNNGFNTLFRADEHHPIQLYAGDVDGNGSIDPIMTHYVGNESVPLVSRDDLIGQVPSLKKKFTDYPSYAKSGIDEVLSAAQRANITVLKASTMATMYLENTGKQFVSRALPDEAQIAPVHAIAVSDFNHDGHDDLILAGNNSHNRIYLGRDDANHGVVLLGDGKGNFRYVPQYESGLNVRGDVRSAIIEKDRVFFGINDNAVKAYKINADRK